MIVGHEHILKDLKRLADGGTLSHGYVFWGAAMVGKKTAALSFARYLESGVWEGASVLQDVLLIEPDAGGTIGIEAVRQIKNFLWQKPNVSARRTLIINDSETMTAEAQNALLKISEEPPSSSLILLVTQDPDALNPTVFSRLQKIYFAPLPAKTLSKWAEERFGKKAAVKSAAIKAQGRPGLVQALLEDAGFAEALEDAEKLVSLPGDKRREFMKKLAEREDFNFNKLLNSLILIAAWNFLEKKEPFLWHALLELRYHNAYFNLNPRLQLESLFAKRAL